MTLLSLSGWHSRECLQDALDDLYDNMKNQNLLDEKGRNERFEELCREMENRFTSEGRVRAQVHPNYASLGYIILIVQPELLVRVPIALFETSSACKPLSHYHRCC